MTRPSPYFRFVAASGMTNLADGVAMLVWAWLASLLTRDALMIAIVPMALRLPWFIFALPAGVITDRVDRRLLILWMDVIRALAFGAAALSIWLALPFDPAPDRGVAEPAVFTMIIIAALIVGAAEVFRDNAAQTMLPAIVPHDRLESANGRLWSVELVGNALIGPALGAMLIAVALPLPFIVNTIAFVVAIWLVANISGNFMPKPRAARNWRAELGEGWQFLINAPLLRLLAWITGFWNLLFQMVMIGLILHVQENLNLGAPAYGLVLAAGAVGGILGGIYAERIVLAIGAGRAAQWTMASSAPAFLAIAYAPGAVTLALVLAIFEFTGLIWNTVAVSYRQRNIPDALMGRVNSLYRLMAWGMMPVGLILSGIAVRVSETFLTREAALLTPFIVAGFGALILTVITWSALGRGFARG